MAITQFFNELEQFKTDENVFSIVDGVQIGLRPSKSGDAVYLLKIRSNQRGQGLASETLGHVCSIADRFAVVLFLEVESDDGLGEKELAEWYWRFGFRGPISEMIREPIVDDDCNV